jgi:hypothetical protein
MNEGFEIKFENVVAFMGRGDFGGGRGLKRMCG